MRWFLDSPVAKYRRKETRGSSISLEPRGRLNTFVTDQLLEIFLGWEAGRQRSLAVFIKAIDITFDSTVFTKRRRLLARKILVPIARQSNQTFGVPPILATAPSLNTAEAKALEHNALLLVWVIFLTTATKLVAEVVIVFVARGSFLRVDALSAGIGVLAQSTRRVGGHASRTTVADKVALVEQFDQRVLAMACNGAGIAHGSGGVIIIGARGGRIASQAGKEILSQWTELMGAGVEGLCIGHGQSADVRRIQA